MLIILFSDIRNEINHFLSKKYFRYFFFLLYNYSNTIILMIASLETSLLIAEKRVLLEINMNSQTIENKVISLYDY